MSEPTIMSLAVDVAGISGDIKTIFKQLEKQSAILESVHAVATQVQLQGKDIAGIHKDVSDVIKDVATVSNEINEIKTKPAKRWDNLVTQIIALVVVLVFGLIVGKIGLS